MTQITIFDKNGNTVSKSHSLRSVIAKNKELNASFVTVTPARSGKGIFFAMWPTGHRVAVMFDSHKQAIDFAKNDRFSKANVQIN